MTANHSRVLFAALIVGVASPLACSGGGSTSKGAGGTTTSSGTLTTTSTAMMSSTGSNAECGDGVVEPPEDCDLGMQNGTGKGCSNTCTFDCVAGDPTKDHCDDANPCNGVETCGADHACHAGTPMAQGSMCGMGDYCVNMNCVAPSCGDAVVETPEECDNGSANGPGTGCESTCKFSCLSTDPMRNCASTNPCVSNGSCSDTTHKCTPGSPVANGTACPNGACQNGMCIASSCTGLPQCTLCMTGFCSGGANGTCKASTCGDGCIDASAGEQCDPPNGTTCDAQCHLAAATCGDGVLQAGETCDDGNHFDLDGCDSNCKYELITRMTSITISGATAPAACTPAKNQLGTQAFTNTALNQLNMTLGTDVSGGTLNILTQFLNMTDLTGVSGSGVNIGVIDGILDPAKGMWPAAGNPEDWWFLADHSFISMGLPTGLVTNGTVTNRNLVAGPSNVNLALALGGSPAILQMNKARVFATLNGTPAPNTPAAPPTMLAAGTNVFQTVTASGMGQGLCGNVTVASLATIPIPSALTTGATACSGQCNGSHAYTYCGAGNPVGPGCNSLLDVVVGGCGAVAIAGNCLVGIVNSTQPDVGANGGAPTPLSLGAGNKVSQNVSNDQDAYSAYLQFTANRAHFTGETCAVNGDCQTGKTCNASKVCQ